MKPLVMLIMRLGAFFAGGVAFNLLIGVFGLWEAIATLIAYVVFVIFTSLRTQPEEKELHA